MGRPKLIEDDRLLEIARRVFREHGHTATTIHVAKAAGISEAALFKRFKTKDALFLAALNDAPVDVTSLLAIDPKLPPRDYLLQFCARTKDHFRQVMPTILSLAAHPRYGKEMMQQIHRHNRVGDLLPILRVRLLEWQQAGQIRATNHHAFLATFIHALNSMAMVEVLSGQPPKPTPPVEMESFVDIIWEVLRPLEPRAPGKK